MLMGRRTLHGPYTAQQSNRGEITLGKEDGCRSSRCVLMAADELACDRPVCRASRQAMPQQA